MDSKQDPAFEQSIDRLLYLMQRLRDPKDGCPWDLKQSYKTIVPYTIEEAYEVAEAIDSNDANLIKDEVGDLLLQVVFYAQIAKEVGDFDFEQVADGVVEKMLRRHPHVFPDGTLQSRAEALSSLEDDTAIASVKANWDAIKKMEKLSVGVTTESILDGIPSGLPSMLRAQKLQKNAAKVGFDWPSLQGALEKLNEELQELNDEFSSMSDSVSDSAEASQERKLDELGDVMFSCVNLARLMGVNADCVLRSASNKFERRFRLMEETLQNNDQPLGRVSDNQQQALDVMERAWQKAKHDSKPI